MKILILAAGYGTRLKALGESTPKPLLPVGGKTLIDHLIGGVRPIPGIREIIVVSNDKFYAAFQDWAGKKKDSPAPIAVLNDGSTSPDNRLGSVGDIDFACRRHPIDDDLLVMGGDNLFDFNLADFIRFSREKAPCSAIGLYDIGRIEDAREFGVVAMDRGGKVTSFEEKPQQPKSSLIAMCLYHFPRPSVGLVFEYLQKNRKADKAGDYIRWLAEEKGVYGFKFEGKWYDIGSLESYHEAQKAFR